MEQKGTVKLRWGDMKEAQGRLNDSSATMKSSPLVQLFHTWCLYAAALHKLCCLWLGASWQLRCFGSSLANFVFCLILQTGWARGERNSQERTRRGLPFVFRSWPQKGISQMTMNKSKLACVLLHMYAAYLYGSCTYCKLEEHKIV